MSNNGSPPSETDTQLIRLGIAAMDRKSRRVCTIATAGAVNSSQIKTHAQYSE
jgi:hypothetical protein